MDESPVSFRDPLVGNALLARLERAMAQASRPVTVMHVCGSHEQAIARYGLRRRLPSGLRVQMGPGCPVCVTDAPEIDACIRLATSGLRVATYGDMLRVPGRSLSLDDARAAGAKVDTIYSPTQVVALARRSADPVIFFATGFETTAVATAAILLADPPPNLFVLSAHKWVPAAMEIVASASDTRIEGYLAAGHAATITGYGVFEPFVARHRRPVVVAGFEPLDMLAALALLVEQIVKGEATLVNAFPRCVTRDGNRRALDALFAVFEQGPGQWRGIAHVPTGNLSLRPAFAAHDAWVRFADVLQVDAPSPPERSLLQGCMCGAIMTGQSDPTACALFGKACRPSSPVGACMVSSEGPCRIRFDHDGGEERS